MEAVAVNFVDSGEVTCCNLVWSLADRSKAVFYFVKMAGSVGCHVALQFEQGVASIKGAFDQVTLACVICVRE